MTATIFPRTQWAVENGSDVHLPSPLTITRASPDCERAAQTLFEGLVEKGIVAARVDSGGYIWVGLQDDPEAASWLQQYHFTPPKETRHSEGYWLDIRPAGIFIAGADGAGAFYGVQSQLNLLTGADLTGMTLFDWPYKPLRGIHLYMPDRQDIPFFKRLLKWLALLKYNTIFLEVSGGMRYQSHPEINVSWEKFCREAEAYPGGPQALQVGGTRHLKDSTHTELGGGSCLEQAEVKELLEYSRSLFFEIVPEVQSLSHSYYLCCAHPEIAELVDDPWPDTYCPSDSRSYELYFDILEEVIAVFQPRLLHIGHDEVYTLGVCPRCQGKSGNDLLAGDLLKIHAFLKDHGVRMALWGDTLMPFSFNAWEGGVARHVERENGACADIPETFRAIEQLPRDILISEWQGNTNPLAMQFFLKEGFEVYCGNFGDNFTAHTYQQWNERSESLHVLGGEPSTWCHVSEFAFSYNGCLFNMAFSAELLWWSYYRDSERNRLTAQVAGVMPQVRRMLGERNSFDTCSKGGSLHSTPVFLPPAEAAPLPFAPHLDGILLNTTSSSTVIPVGQKVAGLVFTHTCQGNQKRRPTWELADPYHQPHENELAVYQVEYQDGSRESIPIYYGTQVARWDIPYGEHIDAVPYEADPIQADLASTGQPITLFRYEWANPHPEATIHQITLTFMGSLNAALWITACQAILE